MNTVRVTDEQALNNKALDRIDRNILTELQNDGRLSNVELSKRVGLSPTPCLERVRRLEKNGYILGYSARLNPKALGASLLVFVEISLNKSSPLACPNLLINCSFKNFWNLGKSTD